MLRSFFSKVAASGLLPSLPATSVAIWVSRVSGSGAAGDFSFASASCLRILAGWKVSALASMVNASLSKLRSTMLPRTAFFDVGHLELAGGLGAQAGGLRHLKVEQLGGGHPEREKDDDIACAVPEHE